MSPFPASPNVGQTSTQGGRTWTYTGVSWVFQDSIEQVFTASGTWYKPTGARLINVLCIGGGERGSDGSVAPSTDPRTGGRGGAAGGYTEVVVDASHVGSTATITVGSAAAAGDSSFVTSTSLTNGANDGNLRVLGLGGNARTANASGGPGRGSVLDSEGALAYAGAGDSGAVGGGGNGASFLPNTTGYFADYPGTAGGSATSQYGGAGGAGGVLGGANGSAASAYGGGGGGGAAGTTGAFAAGTGGASAQGVVVVRTIF